MKPNRIIYTVIVFLVIVSGLFSIWVYSRHEEKDILGFSVSIVGFCIALLALYISVRTYTSIDSVNNISKMDGNILDNEYYVTSVPELIETFKESSEKELETAIFKSIEMRIKEQSDTAVKFADTLQYMIDLIVLLPAIFNSSKTNSESYSKRMTCILDKIERRRILFQSISQGTAIQISETVKLFKAVVSYQKFVSKKDFNVHADLLHVRGPILRNPVTKTIYHNYLGLYYNKKGMHQLNLVLGLGNIDMLSIDGIKKIRSDITRIPASDRETIIMYLKSACTQFDRASNVSGEDVMWPGFIDYNKGRTIFFLSLLLNEPNDWLSVMDYAILYRSRLNQLIAEVTRTPSATPKTHLQSFFCYQEELARLVRLNILIGIGAPKADWTYRGRRLDNTSSVDLSNAFYQTDSFLEIKKYQNIILEFSV